MSDISLLSQISSTVTIDVDSMDPQVAAGFESIYQFCDMTSNQAIVYNESIRKERTHILKSVIQAAKESHKNIEGAVDDAVNLLTVLLAKEVFPYLKGRVHAQTSPSAAYDTEATVQHAKELVSVFEQNGIPRSRVCIKIPATPESIIACRRLEQEGIRTLATSLFSVPQAVAASQAGCLYVAPYFNELRAHFEPSLWKEYKDPAKEHPMSPVISAIVQTFKTIGSTTLVMPASIVTAAEVKALASLHPDHITIPGAVLAQLKAPVSSSPQTPQPHHPELDTSIPLQHQSESKGTSTTYVEGDYLAHGGRLLREALAADGESSRRLADALEIFGEMEKKTKQLIRSEMEKL
ncbi:hypothetical protein JAAARDRAFT_174366 [Jaapia argillacea MUCL 33604]|uniref:Transaldolase n=1 Tax=Jaapia argillacea MUCL 33604 TaxID=933084 RepID=A0A067Q9W4_9AGAM|nr:hypothetical protein JAAARDRAFT_174366 [Jaapia argillacea MUCL 33604]